MKTELKMILINIKHALDVYERYIWDYFLEGPLSNNKSFFGLLSNKIWFK